MNWDSGDDHHRAGRSPRPPSGRGGRRSFLESEPAAPRPPYPSNNLNVVGDIDSPRPSSRTSGRSSNPWDNPGGGARQSNAFWESQRQHGSGANSAVPRSKSKRSDIFDAKSEMSIRSHGVGKPRSMKGLGLQKSKRRMPVQQEPEPETWLSEMFPRKMRKARFGIAMRIMIGVIIALLFFITPWFNAPIKCLGPLLTVLYAFQQPPYLGSAFMCFTIFTIAFITAVVAAGAAIAIGASFFDGLPDGETQLAPVIVGFGVLFVYWLVFIPPLRTSHVAISTMTLIIVIGMPLYAFVPYMGMMSTGIVQGYDTLGLTKEQFNTQFCEQLDTISTQESLAYIDGFEKAFDQVIALALCTDSTQAAFAPFDNRQCITWGPQIAGKVRTYWDQAPISLYLDFVGLFNGQAFCFVPLADEPNVFALALEPGSWLFSYNFFFLEFGTGAFTWLIFQALIAMACIFFISFLPPARFATDHLRTLMRDQVLRLREDRLFGCFPGAQNKITTEGVLDALDLPNSVPVDPLPMDNTIGPTRDRKRLFSADEPLFQAMETMAAVATVEINLTDPGPFVAIWPSYTRIIPLIRTFSNQMALTVQIADLCAVKFEDDESQVKLLRVLDQLVFEMAFCLSLRPTAGGSAVFNVELLCLKLEEKCDAVKQAAYRWIKLPHGKTAEQRILIEGHRLAAMQMAGSACAMAEGIMSMLKAHSEPSWKGLGTSLGGLWIPTGLLGWDILKFWWKVLSSPWSVSWTGHMSWWKDNRVAAVVQTFITLAGVFAAFGILTTLRNFSVYTVNSALLPPGGRMGQWAGFPIAVALMSSWHGSTSRAPMRILSACIGALLGLPGVILFMWGRYGSISPFSNEYDQVLTSYVIGEGEVDGGRELAARVMAVLYLGIVVFMCAYTSVDTTGRFSAYGAFHTQFGYGPFIAAFYAVGIATEGFELASGLESLYSQWDPVVVGPYAIMDYLAMRIIEYVVAMGIVVVAASIWPVRAGSAARKESAKSLRRLGRTLITSAKTWRGDIVAEEKKEAAQLDLRWCDQARGRGNNFILEMDCFGRLRYLFKDPHFFTFWSGNISDLTEMRTLHSDVTMFITQLLKGCRAPEANCPQFLEHLSYTIDCWTAACDRRIGYICDADYPKLLGLKTPTDEALAVHDALYKALPDLVCLAEQEAEEQEEREEAERKAKKAAKKLKQQQEEGIEKEPSEASLFSGVEISSIPGDEGGKRQRERARARELEELQKEHIIIQKTRLAEVELEADQRWQLLIALLTGLERSIFSALPDDVEFDDSDFDSEAPYDYEYARGSGLGSGGDKPVAGEILDEDPPARPAQRLADISKQRADDRARRNSARDGSSVGSSTNPAKRSSKSRLAGEDGVNYHRRSGDLLGARKLTRGASSGVGNSVSPAVRPGQEGMSLERPYDPSMDAGGAAGGHNEFDDAWYNGGGTPPVSEPKDGANPFMAAAIGAGVGLGASAAISAASRKDNNDQPGSYEEEKKRRRRRSKSRDQPKETTGWDDPAGYGDVTAAGADGTGEKKRRRRRRKKKRKENKETGEVEYYDASVYYGEPDITETPLNKEPENNYMYYDYAE